MDIKTLEKTPYRSMYTSIDPEKTYHLTGKELLQLLDLEKNQLVDALPSSVYWKCRKGKLLGCNSYMIELFGYGTKAEVLGKTAYDFIEKEEAERIIASDEYVMQTGIRTESQETGKVKGKQKYFFTSKEPMKDQEGDIVGILGCSIDITALYEAEKKLKDSMGIISGTVSHDLKNNLHALGLIAEKTRLILDKIDLAALELGPEEKDFLNNQSTQIQQILFRSNQSIEASLQQLKEVMSGQTSEEDPEFEVFAIAPIVQELAESYQMRKKEKFIFTEALVDFEVFGDERWCYKIISNLLNNALFQIDKKQQGAIFISSAQTEDHFVLQIKDTAGGLTQERVGALLSSDPNKQVEGTGFGLASAQLIMQKMEGKIEARLVEGDKILFLLWFPKPFVEEEDF